MHLLVNTGQVFIFPFLPNHLTSTCLLRLVGLYLLCIVLSSESVWHESREVKESVAQLICWWICWYAMESDADVPWRDSWPIKDGTEQDTPQQKQSALFILTVLPLTVTFAELFLWYHLLLQGTATQQCRGTGSYQRCSPSLSIYIIRLESWICNCC